MTIYKKIVITTGNITISMLALFCVCSAQGIDTSALNIKGRLVDIGGYKLHLNEQGTGSPTVVLIAGSLAFSFDWYRVQSKVKEFTKVVSYDRPGLAWSDAGPSPRTMRQDVYELHQLLSRANLKPPFVIVSHSYGGLIARMYCKEYPEEVAGMVLVDPTSEDVVLFMQGKLQRMRLLASEKKVPAIKQQVDSLTKIPSQKDVDDLINFMGKPVSEYPFTLLPDTIQRIRVWARSKPEFQIADAGDFWAEELQDMYTDSISYKIKDKPLIVIASGKNEVPKELDSLLTKDEIRKLHEEKLAQKLRISKLSTNRKFIVAEDTGHDIHIEKPEVVIEAIKEVMQSINTEKLLNKFH